MKILWAEDSYALEGACDEDALIAKLSGFDFDTARGQWCGDHDAIEELRRHRLKLVEPLTITELALRNFKSAGAKVLSAIEQSHAEDSDIFIPVPDGLEYLPFQKAGIAYALSVFGRKG